MGNSTHLVSAIVDLECYHNHSNHLAMGYKHIDYRHAQCSIGITSLLHACTGRRHGLAGDVGSISKVYTVINCYGKFQSPA